MRIKLSHCIDTKLQSCGRDLWTFHVDWATTDLICKYVKAALMHANSKLNLFYSPGVSLICQAPHRRGRGGVHCEHASSYALQTWTPAYEPVDSPPLQSMQETSINACTNITCLEMRNQTRNNLKVNKHEWLIITMETTWTDVDSTIGIFITCM